VTFPIVRRLCAGIVTVEDEDLRDAMRFAFERLKLVVEPSGASGLAAILAGRVAVRGARVGVIVSGGNVDPAQYAAVIAPDSVRAAV
jgi:threonine dehydratase